MLEVHDLNVREKILIGLLIVLLTALGYTIYAAFYKEDADIAFKLQEQEAIPVVAENIETEKIVVHVTGAVKNPGVYTLEEGKRVFDAIEIAGGQLSDADLSILNLAQKLHDEDKLYVPKIGEIENISAQESSYFGGTVGISSNKDGMININTADIKELIQLPGIGQVTAQNIINYRSTSGSFKTIEEIKNVSGIGDRKFEQIKDKIKAH